METFQQEVRDWLETNCPASMRTPPSSEDETVWGGRKAVFPNEEAKSWLNAMGSKGWTCPTWPKEYGGGGLSFEENQVLQVELLGQIGDSVDLTPVMLVDGSTVLAKPSELKNVKINAEIVDKGKGKKITGFTYKNKSNQRRRWGHRQNFNEIKITSISRKN